MDPKELKTLLSEGLQAELGAEPRRNFGWEVFFLGGRMFVFFSAKNELVGKWPPAERERLRTEVPGVRPFMGDDLVQATWLRIPLESLDLAEAMRLARVAGEYVQTPEGAPKGRRRKKSTT